MKNIRRFLPVMQIEKDALLGRKGFRPILEILIFFAVFYVANAAQSIPIAIVTIVSILLDPSFFEQISKGTYPTEDYINELATTIADSIMLPSLFFTALTIVVVFIYCRYLEKRPLRSLGFRRGHIALEYGVGLLIGAGLFSLAVGICILTGSLTLSFVTQGVTALIPVFFVGFLIQGMSEEVLCRGYFMISYARRSSMAWAIFLNSAFFAVLHLANPGLNPLAIVNLLLFGIFASVYFLKRGNIWGIGAIHSIWNFMQGNFFGIPVSGMQNLPSVFSSEIGDSFFQKLWNGGAFGLEGGLAVTIVLSAATAVMLFLIPAKRSELAPHEEIPEADGTGALSSAPEEDTLTELD